MFVDFLLTCTDFPLARMLNLSEVQLHGKFSGAPMPFWCLAKHGTGDMRYWHVLSRLYNTSRANSRNAGVKLHRWTFVSQIAFASFPLHPHPRDFEWISLWDLSQLLVGMFHCDTLRYFPCSTHFLFFVGRCTFRVVLTVSKFPFLVHHAEHLGQLLF